MNEEPVLIGKSRSLVGIITDPPEAASHNSLPAFILLNAGVVHRIGPNRHYVHLARKLAALGFVVLRFDFSGLGDSLVSQDSAPIGETIFSEVQEVMDYLNEARGRQRFVLMGISSGAVISFSVACHDPRVVGAVLINPVGYTEEISAFVGARVSARGYWKTGLSEPRRWLNAITGKARYGLMIAHLRSLLAKKKVQAQTSQLAAGFHLLAEHDVRLLFVYSAGDPGLEELSLTFGDQLRKLTSLGQWRLEVIESADHTMSLRRTGDQLAEIVQDWARALPVT